MNSVETGAGEVLKGFKTIIVHIDRSSDPSETEIIGDNESIYRIVLRQIRVGLFKFIDLLGVKHM